MIAHIFPGQASQFVGMGKALTESSEHARKRIAQANEILGFDIGQIMNDGSEEELKQTKVTQPAVFLHSVLSLEVNLPDAKPDAVAGHSLGEISSLVAAGVLSFEAGLSLVSKRAMAMQSACEENPGTMAAILGLEDKQVEEICAACADTVVAANYNCPGQLVISGSLTGIEEAVAKCTEAGAKRALVLPVGGAFHSPLMQPAGDKLKEAIEATTFNAPKAVVYQNVDAKATRDVESIKSKLISQLTAPVRWTHCMEEMIKDGTDRFLEIGGNGKVLRGFLRRINRNINIEAV